MNGFSFVRVMRGFAEGSLVAFAFAFAIALIGTPLTLVARGVYEGLSWLVRLRGETSALVDAGVSVSSLVGTVILVAVLVRLLVGFLNWRRTFRIAVSSGRARIRAKELDAAAAEPHAPNEAQHPYVNCAMLPTR